MQIDRLDRISTVLTYNRVVCDALNFFIQKVPCKKLEGNHSVMGQMKQVHGVYHLFRRYHNIYHFEIVLQSMTNKHYP